MNIHSEIWTELIIVSLLYLCTIIRHRKSNCSLTNSNSFIHKREIHDVSVLCLYFEWQITDENKDKTANSYSITTLHLWIKKSIPVVHIKICAIKNWVESTQPKFSNLKRFIQNTVRKCFWPQKSPQMSPTSIITRCTSHSLQIALFGKTPNHRSVGTCPELITNKMLLPH